MAIDKSNLINQIKNKYRHIKVVSDRALVNRDMNASISMKQDGSVNIIGGDYAQIKADSQSGLINEISIQHTVSTVQFNVSANDVTVNNHKLNSQLYELTDYKQIGKEDAIGGLTMDGYIMVKTWEPNLQKYVLIRRQARLPMFSYLLNAAGAPNNFEMEDNAMKDVKQYKSQIDNSRYQRKQADLFEEEYVPETTTSSATSVTDSTWERVEQKQRDLFGGE